MNKLIISAVIASGLFLVHSPDASAHGAKHNSYRTQVNQHYDYRGAYRSDRKYNRRHHYKRDTYKNNRYRNYRYSSSYQRVRSVPGWLRHDRSFRRWYDRSQLRRNHRLSWNELYDAYRWEHRYDRRYRH